jgi:hypothetical protein
LWKLSQRSGGFGKLVLEVISASHLGNRRGRGKGRQETYRKEEPWTLWIRRGEMEC